jgi:hypothetical protein
MKNVKVIYTEIGQVPVLIDVIKESGTTYYNGTVLGEHTIFIQAQTMAYCLDQLKKAFELSLHFWIRYELSEIGLTYEGKVKKDWYNG